MDAINKLSPSVAIIDYGMGNLKSVERAFLEAGASVQLAETPSQACTASALIFPGQGAIVDTMRRLKLAGWDGFIRDWISADRPFFGICLGLQALFDFSEEGNTRGLGILEGTVRRFEAAQDANIKIPHMGWNTAAFTGGTHLLNGIDPDSEYFYFVHSYYVIPEDPAIVWSKTAYGDTEFCSAIHRGNLVATQFHPEKSQKAGLQLYKNFITTL